MIICYSMIRTYTRIISKKDFMMKKLIGLAALAFSTSLFAADVLHNTQWKTIDDETGKPKAVVEFKQNSDGTLSARIKDLLDPDALKVCNDCTGALKGKPMVGLPIVNRLKLVSKNSYGNGTILDPKSGSTYSLKGQLSADGKKLELRGFKGVSLLGRNQTWYRIQ